MKALSKTRSFTSLALCALALLPACGAGNGDGMGAGTSGTLSVSLTDAPSNQIDSFRVTVSAIDLVKSNNVAVHALAGPVTVDLADLTDTGALLNSVSATVGSYTRATITLDLASAVCMIANKPTPATVHDDQGAAFTAPVVVSVNLPGFLSLGGAAHKLVELDCDLSQSLSIDAANNTVEFTPAFVVRTVLAQQKPVAVAGTLASVDVPNSSFVLTLLDENLATVGSLTCASDNATVFQTDGVPDTGASGLTALSGLALGTWVQAQGTIDPAAAQVLVTNVNAGTGTWNGGTDIVEGVVTDRVGGTGADATLTVRGRSTNAAHDTFQYNTDFTVATTFAGTRVVRHASATTYDTDAINIGQQVRIFGALSGANLDATAGVLREQPTWIFGTAAGAPAGGQLTLALDSVGLRAQTLFNWTADPANFVTDVGTLADSLAIVAGTHVVQRGFFAPVNGGATDFTADHVVDADDAPALFLERNRVGTGFTLALTCTTGRIDTTVTGSAATGEYAILDEGFVGVSNLPANPTPGLEPAASVGLYTLRDITAGTFTVYTHFPTYSSAVNAAITQGAEVRHVAAVGTWTALTSTLSTGLVSIVVQ